MSKPWLKLWVEWIHDPKILHLTLAEKGAWSLLLSLAQQCDAEGHLSISEGNPMTVDDIAMCLHIVDEDERASLESMMTKMEKRGSLTRNAGSLYIVNFQKRQRLAPSDQKEAVRERQRRFREKQRAKTPPLNNPPLDKELYIEGEGEGNLVTHTLQPTSDASLVTSFAVTKALQKTGKNTNKSVTGSLQKLPQKTSYGEGQNVFLTLEERRKLDEKFGIASATERIDALSLYKGSTGKKYHSDYLTILNWERMHQQETKQDRRYSLPRRGRVPSKDNLDEQERRYFGRP